MSTNNINEADPVATLRSFWNGGYWSMVSGHDAVEINKAFAALSSTPSNLTEGEISLPPLPAWALMDNLGNIVPSDVRLELRDYARAAIAADRRARQGDREKFDAAIARANRPGAAIIAEAQRAATKAAAPADAPIMSELEVRKEAERMHRSWHHSQPNRCAIAPWYRLDAEAQAEWIAKVQRRAAEGEKAQAGDATPYGYAAEARDGHITFFKGCPTAFYRPEWNGLMKVVKLYAEAQAGEDA